MQLSSSSFLPQIILLIFSISSFLKRRLERPSFSCVFQLPFFFWPLFCDISRFFFFFALFYVKRDHFFVSTREDVLILLSKVVGSWYLLFKVFVCRATRQVSGQKKGVPAFFLIKKRLKLSGLFKDRSTLVTRQAACTKSLSRTLGITFLLFRRFWSVGCKE